MNKQELIEKYKSLLIKAAPFPVVGIDTILEDLKQLDEPSSGHAEEAPRYVKNVLARLRELPLHDREVWLKAIMSEFEQDFSHSIWREGYEQGKFEGEWVGNQLKDADKIRQELNKVKIPQFIADKIEYCKETDGYSLFHAMDHCYNFNKCADWLESNEDVFARAWLDGYEVEKEKRYRVKFQTGQYLAKNIFSSGEYFVIKTSAISSIDSFTRKELEDADFGWVFDCEGVEVQEVEE